MSFAQLPYEVLEPILLEAVEPGSHAGAQLLLVCGLWHAIGRRRLYERVELKNQEAYDSYFVLGPHVETAWRPAIHEQRLADYHELRVLKLSFAPLKKVPFSLSAVTTARAACGPGMPYFPRLHTIHLSLASGSSYLSQRPKPLSRRVAKFLGDFSPRRLTIAHDSSTEITLAALSSVTLHATEVLELASHHISFLPLNYLRHSPLKHAIVRPYPAIRTRDAHLLAVNLPARALLHVRWGRRADEPWYDREMRQQVEKAVWAARLDGSPAGRWVERLRLEFEDDQPRDDDEDGGRGGRGGDVEYDLEDAVARHPIYPEGAYM